MKRSVGITAFPVNEDRTMQVAWDMCVVVVEQALQ